MREVLAVHALSKLQNIYSVIYAAKKSDFTEFIYLYIFCNPTKTHEQCKELLLHQPNLSYDVSSKLSKWVNQILK